eukprot:767836-Hanusia_phi.AAC.1
MASPRSCRACASSFQTFNPPSLPPPSRLSPSARQQLVHLALGRLKSRTMAHDDHRNADDQAGNRTHHHVDDILSHRVQGGDPGEGWSRRAVLAVRVVELLCHLRADKVRLHARVTCTDGNNDAEAVEKEGRGQE